MVWYAAHAIFLVEYQDGNQSNFPIWEDVFLINSSEEDLLKSAEAAISDYYLGFSSMEMTCDDRPATLVFKGIRKFIECNPGDDVLGHGIEITHSQFEVNNQDDFEKLVSGEPVIVTYEW